MDGMATNDEHRMLQDLVAKSLRCTGGGHGKDHLAAFVEVPRHPVGAAGKDLRLAAVLEPEDAAVLKKTPHDGDDLDLLAHAGNAGA